MFVFLALFTFGSLTPIAQVSADSRDDESYQSESHDSYDDDDSDEDESDDSDDRYEDDDSDEYEDDDSDDGQRPVTTPAANLSTDARIKLLQELLTQLIALLNQLTSDSAVDTPVTPVASSTAAIYTTATVATHNTKADCWSIINSNVYDLTSYIPRHPGGSQNIVDICGKDGTSAFTGQHGGSSKPEATLAGFYLAPLAR